LKYTSYILFALFILASILFLKAALEPEEVPVQITGSVKCGTCHGLKNIGNQQKVWEDSRHSKAFNSLLSDKAKQYTAGKGLEIAEQNKLCLRCHTTKHFLGVDDVDPQYKLNEGVGCEACHGAGLKYSSADIMKEEDLFLNNGGSKGNAETCIKCHSPLANKNFGLREDICPFQEKDFDYHLYLKKIKHPISKDMLE
jgi:hypothetical protein